MNKEINDTPHQISMADLQHSKGRNSFERWLNKHNHFMEFLRTLFAIIMIGLQLYIITQLV
jgi:hypothetical protein